jgi:hypothetical protein
MRQVSMSDYGIRVMRSGVVRPQTRGMQIRDLMRRLHEAEERRRTAPRYSEEYYSALRDVERLARDLWKAAQAEGPVAEHSIPI